MQWLNENSRKFLKRGYLVGDTTPEQRIRQIAERAQELNGVEGFADKFEKYMTKGWYSLASPVWSNFGLERGLPISCFGSFISDKMSNIMYTLSEIGMMSKYGGGTSGYFGELRPRGAEIKNNGEASGSVHLMQLFDKMVDVVSQGSTRRGQFAPYLPIEHPDILEFLRIGTEGNPIQKLTHGVTVTSKWLKEMEEGDMEKRKIWAKLLQARTEVGYPYIMYVDNANKNKPQVYKDKERRIFASNLCSEIMLPSTPEESFVCCLSSLNLVHYDEWKTTDAVQTLAMFLDTVMTEFIDKIEAMDASDKHFMQRSLNFAKNHRALGMGVLGWHSLLQINNLSFESKEAAKLNYEIFSDIKKQADAANKHMAELFGEAPILEGYGLRNTTMTAIAPTTSSAFILGQVSQGIEPIWSNCYVKDIQKVKVTIKNPVLKDLLIKLGKNTPEVWRSIRDNDGSVQKLNFLSDEQKDVFKTYPEINQYAVINQAAVRQNYIDQGQSLNLMVPPKTSAKELNALYLEAHKLGVKALYYQHNVNAAQQLNMKQKCAACEG